MRPDEHLGPLRQFDLVRFRRELGGYSGGTAAVVRDVSAGRRWAIVEVVDDVGRSLGVLDVELEDVELVQRAEPQ